MPTLYSNVTTHIDRDQNLVFGHLTSSEHGSWTIKEETTKISAFLFCITTGLSTKKLPLDITFDLLPAVSTVISSVISPLTDIVELNYLNPACHSRRRSRWAQIPSPSIPSEPVKQSRSRICWIWNSRTSPLPAEAETELDTYFHVFYD